MAPVTVETQGEGELSRQPERGIVYIDIRKEGYPTERKELIRELSQAIQDIQAKIEPLAQRAEDGSATAETAVMRWASGSISTTTENVYKWHPDTEENKHLPLEYNRGAQASQRKEKLGATLKLSAEIIARFRDFDKLSDFTLEIAEHPLVTIGNVEWVLTEETKEMLEADILKASYNHAYAQALTYAEAMGRKRVTPTLLKHKDTNSVHRTSRARHLFTQREFERIGVRTGGLYSAQVLAYVPNDVIYTARCEAKFEVE